MEIFDLSIPFENGMPTFHGDPETRVDFIEGTAPWRVSEFFVATHSGTHIDAPAHLEIHDKTIDQFPLERFIRKGVLIEATLGIDEVIGEKLVSVGLRSLPDGGAVILQTNWDRYWGKPEYLHHPYLSSDAARAIVEAGATLIAIDALNVDSTAQSLTEAHEILFGGHMLIVENLRRLDQLDPGVIYTYAFIPLNLKGADGAPIRAFAWED